MKTLRKNIMAFRGAGDVVHAVAHPIARAIDTIAGTDLKNCGNCQKRREKLNEKISFNMKTPIIILFLFIAQSLLATDYNYSTNGTVAMSQIQLVYCGTNSADWRTNGDNYHVMFSKVNQNLLFTQAEIDDLRTDMIPHTIQTETLLATNGFSFFQGTNDLGLFTNATLMSGYITNGFLVNVISFNSGTNWQAFSATNIAAELGVIASTNGSGFVGIYRQTVRHPLELIDSHAPMTFGTPWTNIYGGDITLTIDGELDLAVSGTITVTLTNLTTAESHDIAGSTLSISGTQLWSYSYILSTNDVIELLTNFTGLDSAAINKTTARIK